MPAEDEVLSVLEELIQQAAAVAATCQKAIRERVRAEKTIGDLQDTNQYLVGCINTEERNTQLRTIERDDWKRTAEHYQREYKALAEANPVAKPEGVEPVQTDSYSNACMLALRDIQRISYRMVGDV